MGEYFVMVGEYVVALYTTRLMIQCAKKIGSMRKKAEATFSFLVCMPCLSHVY